MGSQKKPKISLVSHHSNSFDLANSAKNRKNKKEMVLGHVLAIDFGKSKVGLALADKETKIAFAYKIISNDKKLWDNLVQIIQTENVKKIIIGLPQYASAEKLALEFGKKLEAKMDVAVDYQNEMFTTKMAQNNLKARGAKNIAQKDDAQAAQIILQDWLDKA